eukprot:CAMPEP_0118972098 /NCGR_PEP_ID=MMETSP1173-20130426/8523_1 /TAXON_ID=1034831 /ORGANISM="Rhizochromulina marina cf, Strain CCMP1243" /LENGTH=84 /DNA_ID=CAMNT_0006921615 /DNA_START=27 /DNA_END=277 /DNA_ORIENTATION=-
MVPVLGLSPPSSSSLADPAAAVFDEHTLAFSNASSFWNQALGLLSDLPVVPFTRAGVQQHFPGPVCFGDASFGLPSIEHPSAAT